MEIAHDGSRNMRTNSMRSTEGWLFETTKKGPGTASRLLPFCFCFAFHCLVVARTYLWGTGPQISYEKAQKAQSIRWQHEFQQQITLSEPGSER